MSAFTLRCADCGSDKGVFFTEHREDVPKYRCRECRRIASMVPVVVAAIVKALKEELK